MSNPMPQKTRTSITAQFAFETDTPTDLLLQFETATADGQRICSAETRIGDVDRIARVAAEDGIGERIGFRSEGHVDVRYSATVEITRSAADLGALGRFATQDLPADAVRYLLDSHYCPAARYRDFVEREFPGSKGQENGGARVLAIRDWIARNFNYAPGASGSETTAADSIEAREGVCRDYAHVLIMLARASSIPARYVSCYAPDVTPQDFHAVAEVFLGDEDSGGSWHLVDATMMATPDQTAIIGVGRDAGDVSFLTSFGPSDFVSSEVIVTAN